MCLNICGVCNAVMVGCIGVHVGVLRVCVLSLHIQQVPKSSQLVSGAVDEC